MIGLDILEFMTEHSVYLVSFLANCFQKKCGKLTKLFKTPFRHWPDAKRYFKTHEHATAKGLHSDTYLHWLNLRAHCEGKGKPIDEMIDIQLQQEIADNRKILEPIIDSLVLCGRTGIALRGHRDDSKYQPEVGEYARTSGVGNFIELLNYAVRRGDKVLKNHLTSKKKNASYTSKTSQNDLLECCGQAISMNRIWHL